MDSASGSELELMDQKVEREPTSSEIFFSPEERQFRKQYRMGKSEFCLIELWRIYNTLIDVGRDQEDKIVLKQSREESLNARRMSDPTTERRQMVLQNKYRYLQDGISLIIQAPERPYLLTHKTRALDSPGQRHVLPRAIRVARPEVFVTTSAPFESTTAYTKRWLNVTNLNFEVIRTMHNSSAQTETSDVVLQSKLPSRSQLPTIIQDVLVYMTDDSGCVTVVVRTRKPTNPNGRLRTTTSCCSNTSPSDENEVRSLEQDVSDDDLNRTSHTDRFLHDDVEVDLLDIPLDSNGNPVGQTTGFCEWCGNDILPIPTPLVLSRTWDRRSLYCCLAYRKFLEEIEQTEKLLLNQKMEQQLIIDVKKKVKAIEVPTGSHDVHSDVKEDYMPRTDSTFSRRLLQALIVRKEMLDQLENGHVVTATGTRDLPWDPYETRFNNSRPFNDKVFDEGTQHVYRHAEIVLRQSEIYSDPLQLPDQSGLRASIANL